VQTAGFREMGVHRGLERVRGVGRDQAKGTVGMALWWKSERERNPEGHVKRPQSERVKRKSIGRGKRLKAVSEEVSRSESVLIIANPDKGGWGGR